LQAILKREAIIKDHALTESGFVIHKYRLKTLALNKESLKSLRIALDRVGILERDVLYKFKKVAENLKALDHDFRIYHGGTLKMGQILKHHLRDSFELSRRAKGIVILLEACLAEGVKLSKPYLVGRAPRLLGNLERMSNRIYTLIEILRQLSVVVIQFKKEHYLSSARSYGRIMNRSEAKFLLSKKTLSRSTDRSSGALVGVFDSPPSLRRKLVVMPEDERKNYFGEIGARGTSIVFFETTLKPSVGPIPQSNGLKEYKFPRGIRISNLEAA
jgi:hypothetical protein